MAEHREKHTIFGPFPDVDPLDSARLFLRTNRYKVVSSDTGPTPSELQYEPLNLGEPEQDTSSVDESAPTPDSAASVDESIEDASNEANEADEADEADEDVPSADESDESAPEATIPGDESAVEETSPEEPAGPEIPDEVCVKLVAARGEKWAGFTSSNMADLETTCTVTLDGNSVYVEYLVTTTGQFLNDAERAYWKAEAKALESFMKGAANLANVVSDESERAKSARRELMGRGLWIAAVVFVIVFILGAIVLRV